MNDTSKPILVIGGGIAGMTAAIEAAEVGCKVILVEKEPYLGGRVLRSYKYFPKMCPPACGFEINCRRIRQNPRIQVFTLSSVEDVSGSVGEFKVRIKTRPRYMTSDLTGSAEWVDQLESERPDEFNLGLSTTRAVYYPHQNAFPPIPVLDLENLSAVDREKIEQTSPKGMIDWGMTETFLDMEVAAIIVATGWRPYDANRLDNLGYKSCGNVITNVEMERFAAKDGPTGGQIISPTGGEPASNVAFVQCAGSRDENHLAYCSAVCCMASLKQVRYLREFNPASKATVFYIDIRTIGRLEKFYFDLLDDQNVTFIKGKVAKVSQDHHGKLHLEVEDTIAGQRSDQEFDLVVLATGIVPNTENLPTALTNSLDEFGFLGESIAGSGIFTAGCARNPCDVSRTTKESTAAALKAIQCLNQGDQVHG